MVTRSISSRSRPDGNRAAHGRPGRPRFPQRSHPDRLPARPVRIFEQGQLPCRPRSVHGRQGDFHRHRSSDYR